MHYSEKNTSQQTIAPEQPSAGFSSQYEFIESPGHVWLKVPLAEIVQLGIAKRITSYSYMDREFVYLEEDIDAGVFIRARIGVPTDYQQCSAEDDAKAKEFCINALSISYQEYPWVRELPRYQADCLISEAPAR